MNKDEFDSFWDELPEIVKTYIMLSFGAKVCKLFQKAYIELLEEKNETQQ